MDKHNPETERAVLGSVLYDPACLDGLVVEESDFYEKRHQIIWRAFRRMQDSGQPIDLVNLCDFLTKKKSLKMCGDNLYVAGLTDGVFDSTNAESYSHAVKADSIKRQIHAAAHEIIRKTEEPVEDVTELVSFAQQTILDVERSQTLVGESLTRTLSVALKDIEKLSECGVTGLSTGINSLDEACYGMNVADLIILAGRPGMGKTALALNIALHTAYQKRVVAVFSMEMDASSLCSRLIRSEAEVVVKPDVKISSRNWSSLIEACDKVSSVSDYLIIDDKAEHSPQQIRSKARRLKSTIGLDLVIVDYLQLISNHIKGSNREGEVADASRQMKVLAKENSCSVLLLSQLNRGVEGREKKRPRLSDLRESGAIEQDADKVIFTYFDDQHYLDVAKHRNGPTEYFPIVFNQEIGKFREKFIGGGHYGG